MSSRLFLRSFVRLTAFYLIVGLLTRIVLLSSGQTVGDFSFVEWLEIFGLGIVNDLCIAIVGFGFAWLCLTFFSRSKYRAPWGYVIWILIGLALIYVCAFNTIFDEYGSVVPTIVKALLAWKFISFGLRLFLPRIRTRWSKICYYAVCFVLVAGVLLVAAGEYFFWDEFGVRYNFIAVDYLVYTNEVVGNIMESYPMGALISILVIITGAITWLIVRKNKCLFDKFPTFRLKIALTVAWVVLAFLALQTLRFNTRFQQRANVYANELQANGAYKFFEAFSNNKLDYADFYTTLPREQAVATMNAMYHSTGADNLHAVTDSLPEIRKNIVLITVESLSASYLTQYGNTQRLTPNLDSLMRESVVFDSLFAAGNRTVRGLEALTLCLPPSPGESIIKRSDNANLFSTGKVLKEKGYTVQFLYGGDSYFDNMQTFFAGNGYQIIDKKDFANDEITFATVWGVCDEDMFTKALRVFSADAVAGKPFFGHIMTTSNHRPYTYPDGRIDIPPTAKSRAGGVKYTDYAIGKFLREAQKETWFANTVFVIVADHCASSAGKTTIPLDKYHIPALIYAPGFITPAHVETLCSQIDLMPTLFSLLHLSYDSYFYGTDIFSPDYLPKAFVATYQNLGYLRDNIFTILSPVRAVEQSRIAPDLTQTPLVSRDTVRLDEAIANYQTIDYRRAN